MQRAITTCAIISLSSLLVVGSASATTLTLTSTAESFTAADKTGLDLGGDAAYALIDLGSGTTLGWNSGPVNGNVLVGNHVTVSASGGNNGGLNNGSKLYYDTTTLCNPSPCLLHPLGSGLQKPPVTQLVPTSTTSTALSTAQNVSNFAKGLTATLPVSASELSSVTDLTINGSSGLNVITLPSLHNVVLTLSGPADAFFVINLSGELQTNKTMTLSGGVTAADVLWNLTGTSNQVLNTSGGNSLVGTFLATDGGQFQFSELRLSGELINTDGNVQLVSGSELGTAEGFTVPVGSSQNPTPLPAALPLFATGIGGLGLLGWRRKRKAQAA